ncbi:H-NS histone family protein [Lysobacter capsici]|nr:H-NS family nucleoid-associated regulatory protein [Lysobacter capsici]UOF17600.1 H-NS histone family protein [Lysobacter capsici]
MATPPHRKSARKDPPISCKKLQADQPAAEIARKTQPPRRKTNKVAPKHRDPGNKRNAWSGRERMPRWLAPEDEVWLEHH